MRCPGISETGCRGQLLTLYRSESCKRKLGKTLACGPPGMANQVHQACHRHYWYYAIACRPTWLAAVFCTFSTFFVFFIIWMPNRSCILELRANQCLVCNFLFMPRCKCLIAPKKTQSLSCSRRDFSNMLTPFQVVSVSNSKVFGGLNLFQFLLM